MIHTALAIALLAGPTDPPKRPNIVVIYADDHAQRAVGCYGSGLNRTPHIDRLAAQGMRFENSFVCNSICGPARASLLTGLHSHANGKITNRSGFRDDLPTFATMLRAAGYRTAMVGKWHLPSNPRGFDHWAIAKGGYYNPDFVTAKGRQRQEGYTTEVITREALRWMTEQREAGRPFMAWICHDATHRTWMPSPRHLTAFDGVTVPEPRTLFDDYAGRSRAAPRAQMRIANDLFPAYDLKLPITGEGILDDAAQGRLGRMNDDQRSAWDAAYGPRNAAFASAGLGGTALVRWKYQRYIKDYLRCAAALDDSVGEVTTYLQKHGIADDTVVIYTSDQGFFLGEHGWYDKRWMYEPALRTPLVVRWPGVVEPASVNRDMVQNIDVAPTLLEIGGLEAPPEMHGDSLVPVLRGKRALGRDAIYYEYHQRDEGRITHTVAPHYGVRTARHKLLRITGTDEWELYDLERDPDEMRNVYGSPAYGDVQGRLLDRLAALRRQYGVGDATPRAPLPKRSGQR